MPMARRRVRRVAAAAAAACCSVLLASASTPSPVADAAMARNTASARELLRAGADVNAAQGDGMTALHWAATHDDADLAGMLLYAGANVRATTRLGGYTPLHLASKMGYVAVMTKLVEAGAPVDAPTATGATALMLAAASGSAEAVSLLLERGADPNVREKANQQTALMFAAALDRPAVVALLLQREADAAAVSKVTDLANVVAPEDKLQEDIRKARETRPAPETETPPAPENETPRRSVGATSAGGGRPAAPRNEAPRPAEVAGVTRPYSFNELIGKQGGLTALHFAARQGAFQTVRTLVEKGADVNLASPADGVTPLLIATINGQFDIAQYLLEHGANPNLANNAGVTPLYATLNVEWAPRMFYPQPRAHLQQQTSYLDLMRVLLEKGADPTARVNRKLWFTQYNFDLLRIDESGATPFWRAAYASDVEAMKLLAAHGADPQIPTVKPAENNRFRQGGTRGADESKDHSGLPPVPVGGAGVPPLLAAAGVGYGEGFAGNAHRFAPSGMLAAVKYLVEELGADVNAVDHDGNTAVHHAAARGDNEMITYLVSKGADVKKVNRGGQTTVDMANGPVQRVQPFPETIKLLEGLGAKNNNKCVSC
jgi:ankyrin repeat protein